MPEATAPSYTLHHGDCLEVMKWLEPASVDAVVTDPPYGLAFMGKSWDHGVPGAPFWTEALRVAKPGAHLLAFGGTRTYHRLACAIEDAGWEIRDCLSWLYGSGFPKSHNVANAIDKSLGHGPRGRAIPTASRFQAHDTLETKPLTSNPVPPYVARSTQAEPWTGWGTALKPGWEPVILARKPLVGTVAANVAAHGTGALNIDGCRIACDDKTPFPVGDYGPRGLYGKNGDRTDDPAKGGRWPANVALDEAAAAMLDEQSGERQSGSREAGCYGMMGFNGNGDKPMPSIEGDSGGASRFFYTAKASRAEREAGLTGRAKRAPAVESAHSVVCLKCDRQRVNVSGACTCAEPEWGRVTQKAVANTHPTVKPVDLMRWLVRLVTPLGGTVLDPFTGSGTTGIACAEEGCRFIGIEREAEYVAIAKARIEAAQRQGRLFA